MSLTQQQQEDEADQDLATKNSLEVTFLSPLLALFGVISNDLFTAYNTTGNIVSAFTYTSNFQDYFNNLYTKTSNEFKGSLDSQIDDSNAVVQANVQVGSQNPLGPKNASDIIDQLNQQVDNALTGFINSSVSTTTNEVVNTTNTNISTALAFAIAAQIANDLSRQQTASLLQQKFVSLTNGRSPTIVATSVQQAAEGTKFITVQQYNKMARPITGKNSNVQKVWLTRMDDKVRLSHREADFQTVDFNSPFIVQQQQLMFPGDTSLGATANNVINCRCIMIPLIT